MPAIDIDLKKETCKYLGELLTLWSLHADDVEGETLISIVVRSGGSGGDTKDCLIVSTDNPIDMVQSVLAALAETPASSMAIKCSCQDGKVSVELGKEVQHGINASTSTIH